MSTLHYIMNSCFAHTQFNFLAMSHSGLFNCKLYVAPKEHELYFSSKGIQKFNSDIFTIFCPLEALVSVPWSAQIVTMAENKILFDGLNEKCENILSQDQIVSPKPHVFSKKCENHIPNGLNRQNKKCEKNM